MAIACSVGSSRHYADQQKLASRVVTGGVTAIDFERTAGDYARHRTGFPEIFFERLLADGRVHAGDAVLDLGTGTGTVARGLALRGCEVTGLDHSAAPLAQAAEMDRAASVQVKQVRARVENADFEPASYDVVTAGQCWHSFERARSAALVRKWLRPGGRFVIAHFDWVPLNGNMVQDTERLILACNAGWTMHSASAGVGDSLDEARVHRFDAELANMLATRHVSEPMAVPHRLWVLSTIVSGLLD
jgi:SAM-dependent methyltransferase